MVPEAITERSETMTDQSLRFRMALPCVLEVDDQLQLVLYQVQLHPWQAEDGLDAR